MFKPRRDTVRRIRKRKHEVIHPSELPAAILAQSSHYQNLLERGFSKPVALADTRDALRNGFIVHSN